MLHVAGPPELADRLDQLAAQDGPLDLVTPFGLFTAQLAGDAALFTAAGERLLHYLKGTTGRGITSREHIRYWLRCAADEAQQEARHRS